MQLEQMGVVVRPRNHWESIDLGFSMVRLWWKPLYQIWFAVVLPIFIAAWLIVEFTEDFLWLVLLIVIIWWIKPLFDRIILHFLSRAVFGEQPTIRQIISILPRLFRTQLGLALTIRRFDFARSFNLSVWQLEELRGRVATERIKLLQKKTRNTAVWLTIVCLHLAVLLKLSLFLLVYWMIPINYDIDLFDIIFYSLPGLDALNMLIHLLALSIVEPLYVAAGFALYLNRRTHLEGWDIELAFRRIAIRLAKEQNQTTQLNSVPSSLLIIHAALLITGLMLLASPRTTLATPAQSLDPSLAKQYITEILEQPEFQTTRETCSWDYQGNTTSDQESTSEEKIDLQWLEGIAQFFEVLLWLLIGIMIILFFTYGLRWLERVMPSIATQATTYQVTPRILAQPTPTSHLPADIPQQAWQMWQKGANQAALSLLYRGALAVLITRDGLTIHDSATENECLYLVKQQRSPDLASGFAKLTQIWQQVAYAKRLPSDLAVQQLCEEWQHHFGSGSGENNYCPA